MVLTTTGESGSTDLLLYGGDASQGPREKECGDELVGGLKHAPPLKMWPHINAAMSRNPFPRQSRHCTGSPAASAEGGGDEDSSVAWTAGGGHGAVEVYKS